MYFICLINYWEMRVKIYKCKANKILTYFDSHLIFIKTKCHLNLLQNKNLKSRHQKKNSPKNNNLKNNNQKNKHLKKNNLKSKHQKSKNLRNKIQKKIHLKNSNLKKRN